MLLLVSNLSKFATALLYSPGRLQEDLTSGENAGPLYVVKTHEALFI